MGILLAKVGIAAFGSAISVPVAGIAGAAAGLVGLGYGLSKLPKLLRD